MVALNFADQTASSLYLVEAVWRQGYAARIRVTRMHDDGCKLPAMQRWCAIYSSQIFANGWQPYDQPNAAAYLPLHYGALDRIPLDDAYTLLLERTAHPRAGRIVPAVHQGAKVFHCDEPALRRVLGRIPYDFGLRGGSLLRCVRTLRGRGGGVDVLPRVPDLAVA